MGYRMNDRHDRYVDEIDDLATQSIIMVDNGTISRISILCFYGRHDVPIPHDGFVTRHDHLGWPSPDSIDRSYQPPMPPAYGKVIVVNGIDLAGEGYDTVEVALHEPPSGLTATGELDGSTVRLTIVTMCNDAVTEDVVVPFCVYATGEHEEDDNTTTQLRDVVTKGIIRVVAGPIGQE